LKLLLLFNYFWISISASFALTVKDRAYVRQGEAVFFESEVSGIMNKLDEMNCMFGDSVFYTKFRNKAEKIKRHIQLKNHVEENKFRIRDREFTRLLKRLSKNECGDTSVGFYNIEKNKHYIYSEVFLQELVLGIDKKSSNRVLSNLKKLLDIKYPVHFYE
tara:strand:- start:362 stop:844 length:483 start_codon:yes stop_codon:yes gene_type:complete